ncbi:MAG TPA: rubrerythrin [Bacteroidetes bacterium]|nr:rubrerythrin [bacterium BMS3Bbin04]HDO65350.1 rubrerythrin [Bacteroidota bacterium]HEX04475.1 rubrerythrin [Bacteroidota bacterium]
MNVFEYAMQMEKDGETYYRELAEKTQNEGLKTILIMVADEEVKHYNLFKSLIGKNVRAQSLPPSDLLKNTVNVFQKMAESGEKFPEDGEAKAQYAKAKKIEDDAAAFYTEKANETSAVHEKDLLLQIAEEEKRHSRLFQEFIDFVTTPDQWLEDAEWNNLKDF